MNEPEAQAETPPDVSTDVANAIVEALLPILTRFPQVKTFAVSIGWNGNANDGTGTHGVWLGADGPVRTPDAIVGSLFQTLRMLDQQAGRALDWLKEYREEILRLHQEQRRGQDVQAGAGTGSAPALEAERSDRAH